MIIKTPTGTFHHDSEPTVPPFDGILPALEKKRGITYFSPTHQSLMESVKKYVKEYPMTPQEAFEDFINKPLVATDTLREALQKKTAIASRKESRSNERLVAHYKVTDPQLLKEMKAWITAPQDEEVIQKLLIRNLQEAPNPRNLSMQDRIKNLADWAEKTQTPVVKEEILPGGQKLFSVTEAGLKKIYGNCEKSDMSLTQDDEEMYVRWKYTGLRFGQQSKPNETHNEKQPTWAELAGLYQHVNQFNSIPDMHQMQARSEPQKRKSYLEEDDSEVLCVWVRDGVHIFDRIPAASSIPFLVENKDKVLKVYSAGPKTDDTKQ